MQNEGPPPLCFLNMQAFFLWNRLLSEKLETGIFFCSCYKKDFDLFIEIKQAKINITPIKCNDAVWSKLEQGNLSVCGLQFMYALWKQQQQY